MRAFEIIERAEKELLESDVFTRTTEQHLIQKAVGLAGCVADSVSGADPRLFPRDDAVFHFGDDAGSDANGSDDDDKDTPNHTMKNNTNQNDTTNWTDNI